MKVLISIPALNEERTLGPVLDDIHSVMKPSKYTYEIQVIDDGSRDKTVAVAKSKNASVISHPRNKGLAEAFRTEMKAALKKNPDIIVHTDADGQYLARDILRLLEQIESGYDLVLGSRFAGRIETMPFLKKFGNIAFSVVLTQITKRRISDGQTGFRAFTKEVASIPIMSSHTYTQEQIIRAAKEKFRIKEIPIYFAKRGGGTKSRLISNPLEYATKAWINIFRIYRDYDPLKFFLSFGIFFFGIGFIIGLWLVFLFLTTGSVTHIPATILAGLLMSVGIQVSLFGFLADMIRR